MAITEKEFQVPVGSHTDEEFEKLKAENEALGELINELVDKQATDILLDEILTGEKND